ncbi:MAG: aminotransferase class IV [Deltaproteobacteria bacterium]|nr:aminotransferase class IV [Deltaproteobacteria bacterium]
MSPDVVPFDAPAVERGFGFFETLLLLGRRAILWAPHARRLLATLDTLGLPAPSHGTLEAAARAALAGIAGGDEERALRLTWIAVGHDVDSPSSWRLDASLRAIPPTTLARRAGSRAVTAPEWLRRDSPGFKSTSYFGAVAAQRYARRSGGDEALFRDRGLYVEGASTGLVAWNGGRLAGLGPGGLPSVTAEAFLEGAGERRRLEREELLSGALLLGSLTTAAPLLSLDGTECARPPEMLRACEAFRERLRTDAAMQKSL